MEQRLGSLREHAPHLAAFALHALDLHVVISRRGVTQPRDDGGLSTLFNRDALGPRDGAAAHRRRVRGDRLREAGFNVGVARVKSQELPHGGAEVFDVLGLRLAPPAGVGGFALGILWCRALGRELGLDPLDGCARRPHAATEDLAPALLLHRPRRPGQLHAARQPGIAGREQRPILRRAKHRTILTTNTARIGTGRNDS